MTAQERAERRLRIAARAWERLAAALPPSALASQVGRAAGDLYAAARDLLTVTSRAEEPREVGA